MRLSDTGLTVLHDAEFDDLGLLPNRAGVLSYLSDPKLAKVRSRPRPYDLGAQWGSAYLEDLGLIHEAPMVGGPVITTIALARECQPERGVIVALDPEAAFWDLHARLVRQGFYPTRPNVIGRDCRIHPSAVIGGSEYGLDRKHGLVPNGGYVRIGERVFIGANTCVDRSVWKTPTTIDDDTHIDNLVHVAHNVQIGKRCTIIAGTVLGGSCVIEDDCFLGIGVRVRPGVRIGTGSFIGMSVTVLADVPAGTHLTCRARD